MKGQDGAPTASHHNSWGPPQARAAWFVVFIGKFTLNVDFRCHGAAVHSKHARTNTPQTTDNAAHIIRRKPSSHRRVGMHGK